MRTSRELTLPESAIEVRAITSRAQFVELQTMARKTGENTVANLTRHYIARGLAMDRNVKSGHRYHFSTPDCQGEDHELRALDGEEPSHIEYAGIQPIAAVRGNAQFEELQKVAHELYNTTAASVCRRYVRRGLAMDKKVEAGWRYFVSSPSHPERHYELASLAWEKLAGRCELTGQPGVS